MTAQQFEKALAKTLKQAADSVTKQLAGLVIADLPGVLIDGKELWCKLPNISAVYFLRMGLPEADWGTIPVILYIGRATNLRGRFYNGGVMGVDHAQLEKSLALADVSVNWLAVDREYLAIVESILIRMHQPQWNQHRP